MQKNRFPEPFRWSTCELNFDHIFFRKGGSLKQGAITYSAKEFCSWEHLKMCSGVLWAHFRTGGAESWGGEVKVLSGAGLYCLHKRERKKAKKNLYEFFTSCRL